MLAILGGGGGLVSQGWVYELPGKRHLKEWSQKALETVAGELQSLAALTHLI